MPGVCLVPVAIHFPSQLGAAAVAEVCCPASALAVTRCVRHVIAPASALNNLPARAADQLVLSKKPLQLSFTRRRFCAPSLRRCSCACYTCVRPLAAQHAKHVAAAALRAHDRTPQRIKYVRRLHSCLALRAVHKAYACGSDRCLLVAAQIVRREECFQQPVWDRLRGTGTCGCPS